MHRRRRCRSAGGLACQRRAAGRLFLRSCERVKGADAAMPSWRVLQARGAADWHAPLCAAAQRGLPHVECERSAAGARSGGLPVAGWRACKRMGAEAGPSLLQHACRDGESGGMREAVEECPVAAGWRDLTGEWRQAYGARVGAQKQARSQPQLVCTVAHPSLSPPVAAWCAPKAPSPPLSLPFHGSSSILHSELHPTEPTADNNESPAGARGWRPLQAVRTRRDWRWGGH